MGKTTKTSFAILLLFALTSVSFGQSVRPLKNSPERKRKDLYIKLHSPDSLDYIKVFIINRSEKSRQFYGYYAAPIIKTEAKDEDGNWQQIKLQAPQLCGLGYQQYQFPKNYYTFQKKEKLQGDFKTEVRYSIEFTDTIIYSKSFEASLSKLSFIFPYENYFERLLEKQASTNDPHIKAKINLRFAKIFLKGTYYDEAMNYCLEALKQDSTFYDAYIFKGHWYVMQAKNCINLSELQQSFIVCAAIAEWEKIPPNQGEISFLAQKRIRQYAEFLPDRFSYGKHTYNICKEENGKLKCLEKCLVKDYVEMKFRDEYGF